MKITHDSSAKPYHRCLSCHQFRKSCGGIPTRGMDLHEWCEYMRDVKEIAHLTNHHIAEDSEVSVKTIERIMAISCEQDIMRATARRIELAVIGPVTRHICALDLEGDLAAKLANLEEEIQRLRKENDRYIKIIDRLTQ